MNGYIKLYRSLMDWEWYQDGNTLRVFLHLLLDANHKAKKWQGVEVNPGQTITSYEMISKKTGISVQSVRTSIKRLKSTGELTSKSTNRYTLITIEKWGSYQNGEASLTSESTSQLTINQQAANKQLTTNKNVKNEEESKEDKEGAVDYDLSDDVRQALNDFIEHRKAMKKKLTDKAIDLIVKKLDKLANNDAEKILMLEKSIENGWSGVFELKPHERIEDEPEPVEPIPDWKETDPEFYAECKKRMDEIFKNGIIPQKEGVW